MQSPISFVLVSPNLKILLNYNPCLTYPISGISWSLHGLTAPTWFFRIQFRQQEREEKQGPASKKNDPWCNSFFCRKFKKTSQWP